MNGKMIVLAAATILTTVGMAMTAPPQPIPPGPDKPPAVRPDEKTSTLEGAEDTDVATAQAAYLRAVALATGPRDPFWPIGWHPPTPVPPENPEDRLSPDEVDAALIKWDDARDLVAVDSVNKIGIKYIAVLRGVKGFVEQGDKISIGYQGMLYSWKVADITGEGMALEQLEAQPIQ